MSGSSKYDGFKVDDISTMTEKEIENLIENHNLLNVFMDSIEDGFSILDKDLVYLAVNDAILSRTSLTKDEIIGKYIGDIAPIVETTGRADIYKTVLETGIPHTIDRIRSYDGIRIMRVIAFKSGENLGLITRDISDIVKFETTLLELQKHAHLLQECTTLEEVFDAAVGAMTKILEHFSCDILMVKEGHLVQVASNNLPLDLKIPLDGNGLTVQAVNTRKSVLENDVVNNPNYIIAEIEPGKPYPEFPISRSELVTPIIVDENVIGVLNIESKTPNAFSSNDRLLLELLAIQTASAISNIHIFNSQLALHKEIVDNKVRIEQAEELNRLKTNFMSSATHEIRTPITSIKGYVDMILEDQLDLDTETLFQYLEVIKRNIDRLEYLSDDLLENLRLEENRLELNYSMVNFPRMVKLLIDEMQPILQSKKQSISYKCSGDEASIWCDEARISQVITNLLSNASHYSSDKSEISLECFEEIDHMRVVVSDNGVGIDEKDLSKLFKPFPDIQSRVAKHGTGLGLSICKGIIDLHGGEIWVESEGIGFGSTFSFTIPKNRKPS